MTAVDLDARLRTLAPTTTVDPDGLERARTRVRHVQLAEPPRAVLHRRPASRRGLWVGTSVAAAVAVAVAVVVATSSPEPAFATWTATPAVPDPATAGAALTSCRSAAADGAEPAPVLVEQRGAVVLTLLEDGAWSSACIWSEHPGSSGSISGSTEVAPAPPAADALVLTSYLGTWAPEDGDWSVVYGRVGRDVARVVVSRDEGGPVTATVTDGRFAAWWPTDELDVVVTPYGADGAAGKAVPTTVP